MPDFDYYQFNNESHVNTLVIENLLNFPLMVAIRVDGYLWDLLLLQENEKRYYPMYSISSERKLSVHPVDEDVDLTLPENASYLNRQLFKE